MVPGWYNGYDEKGNCPNFFCGTVSPFEFREWRKTQSKSAGIQTRDIRIKK